MRIGFRPKRIYYPTGLISLVLLPLSGLLLLDYHHAFEKRRVIEVNWWSPALHERNPNEYPLESHPLKNYTDFIIDGNDNNLESKILTAQLSIRKLMESKDTTKGIHFHFCDNAKYASFIKVINICLIENVKVFIPYESDIWILNPINIESKIDKPLLVCGVRQLKNNTLIKSELETFFFERNKNKIIRENVPTIILMAFLFASMTILSIKRIVS